MIAHGRAKGHFPLLAEAGYDGAMRWPWTMTIALLCAIQLAMRLILELTVAEYPFRTGGYYWGGITSLQPSPGTTHE